MHESTGSKTYFVWRLEVSCVVGGELRIVDEDGVTAGSCVRASFAENWISSGYTRKIFQDKQVGGACMYEVALPCGT